MKLSRVENKRVVFRIFSRNARASDGAGYLRKEGDLFVIVTKIFRTGGTLVLEKGCLEPEQSITTWVSMSSLLPSGQRTVTPRTAPSSESSGFLAVPRITVAPRVSTSLSIIVSKSLRPHLPCC